MHKINQICGDLLPAYKRFVPTSSLIKLSKDVADIVPPLSEADTFALYVRLPILGAALHSSGGDDKVATQADQSESIDDIVHSMLGGLTQFVLGAEYDARARSAAASCIHATISLYGSNITACPVLPIVKDIVNPALASATSLATAKDCLNLLALLVSHGLSPSKLSSTNKN